VLLDVAELAVPELHRAGALELAQIAGPDRRAGAYCFDPRRGFAVPVAAESAVDAIEKENGEVVTLVTPRRFRSVGEWYVDFGQLTDADVLTILSSWGTPAPA